MASSLMVGWDNFFVIAGSSAAGLTGLTFIVITLAAQGGRVNPRGLSVFVTPTIVHFAVVLGYSAFLSMPRLNALSLSLSFGVGGAAGLTYSGFLAGGIRRITSAYVPAHEDWIWNVILPSVAYGALVAAAPLIWRGAQSGLYVAAGAFVLLLLIGIHNAWDIAVWNSTHSEPTAPERPAATDEP
jgi:hypothetical protein